MAMAQPGSAEAFLDYYQAEGYTRQKPCAWLAQKKAVHEQHQRTAAHKRFHVAAHHIPVSD